MKKTDWKKTSDADLVTGLSERAQKLVSARFTAAGAKQTHDLRTVRREIAQIKTEQRARLIK